MNIVNKIKRLIRRKSHSKQIIKMDKNVDHMTQQLVINAINSQFKTVEDVMIDRSQVIALEHDMSINKFIEIFKQHQHSRYPVIDDEQKVIGIVLAKDVFSISSSEHTTIHTLTRNTIYTPKTQRISHILLKLKNSRRHMAIVIDEYGNFEGIVTIENIIESIVGAIEDEHDPITHPPIQSYGHNRYISHGHVRVDTINQHLGANLDNSKFETLSGIITHHMGKIPNVGDQIDVDHLRFKVLSSDSKVIQKILITKLNQD